MSFDNHAVALWSSCKLQAGICDILSQSLDLKSGLRACRAKGQGRIFLKRKEVIGMDMMQLSEGWG